MRPTAPIHEVFKMRFLDIFDRFDSGRLSINDAADILGVSLSTLYRKRKRFEEEGEEGLADRRIGKLSRRRVPVDEVMRIISLYKTHYYDFTVKHFHEHLQEQGFRHSYTFVKNVLQTDGAVKKAKKRGKHRLKRMPKPLTGMMLHQDGSSHEWVSGKKWDLIVTMDDATNEVYSMFFCDEEGTQSSFLGFNETFSKHGLPCSIYVDRASHYFFTPEAGGKVDKNRLTQVGRAMKQLGIEMIAAYSPEARGRSERMFGTLQNRLPQELRLKGITDMNEANRFIYEEFLPKHNTRFMKPAELEGTSFVSLYGHNLKDTLCIHDERKVSNDNTVRYKGNIVQILSDNHRLHYVKSTVRVHEYCNGEIGIFYGPRKLDAVLCTAKGNKEGDLSDAFIAFVPVSYNREGEAETSPYPDSGNRHGAQVTRQCCPILRTA